MESENFSIICKDLKKSFGTGEMKVEALRGIDLTVFQKELLILIGPSGSGKTTLLSIIAGLLNQEEGSCLVLGRDINHLAPLEKSLFRGKNIGFIFQNFNLVPMLNIVENVALPLLIQKVPLSIALKSSIDLLEKLGLGDKIHRYPQELSGGEQQRASIARSCIHKPQIILCDEPTSFLDYETGMKVIHLLQNIQQESSCTLIIVTHDVRILNFADRIVKVEDGRIVK